MKQPKRHHFVPKAYLNAFQDGKGRVYVYRKDRPSPPLYVTPDATQFRGYYYSQPTADGRKDNHTLEQLFSTIEGQWPALVRRMHAREDVNDSLANLLEFIVLQRVRVPAARDATETLDAHVVKTQMRMLLAQGHLPPPPAGLEDLPEQVEVAVDPHRSIHAMPVMIRGIAKLFEQLGFVAIHNLTQDSFLTSDNPVIWLDPSLPFDAQRPYAIGHDCGPVLFYFPVSPRLAIVGTREHATCYRSHGLTHSDVSDENFVHMMNVQVCRFAYEAVISQTPGHDALVTQFADVSPVNETTTLYGAKRAAVISRMVFGARIAKPKWKDD